MCEMRPKCALALIAVSLTAVAGGVCGFAAQRTLRHRETGADHAGLPIRVSPVMLPLATSSSLSRARALSGRLERISRVPTGLGFLRALFGAHELEDIRADTAPGESPCSRRPLGQDRFHDRHRDPPSPTISGAVSRASRVDGQVDAALLDAPEGTQPGRLCCLFASGYLNRFGLGRPVREQPRGCRTLAR